MHKKIINAAAGLWSDMKETGVEYERMVRKGWKKRLYKNGKDEKEFL